MNDPKASLINRIDLMSKDCLALEAKCCGLQRENAELKASLKETEEALQVRADLNAQLAAQLEIARKALLFLVDGNCGHNLCGVCGDCLACTKANEALARLSDSTAALAENAELRKDKKRLETALTQARKELTCIGKYESCVWRDVDGKELLALSFIAHCDPEVAHDPAYDCSEAFDAIAKWLKERRRRFPKQRAHAR